MHQSLLGQDIALLSAQTILPGIYDEGSLRVIGGTIRVTAQLIDARISGTIWAESYDHTKSSLAGIQDDIVDAIVAEAMATLTEKEYDRVRVSAPDELDDIDICLPADDMSYFPISRRGQAKALILLEEALLRFPDSFEILAELATNYATRSSYGLDKRSEDQAKAEEALRKAMKLNPSSERVLLAAVVVTRRAERHDESLLHARKLKYLGAVIGGYILGNALVSHGKFVEARAEYERWLHLAGKRNFRRPAVLVGLALSHMGTGDFAEAEKLLRESLRMGPDRGTQLSLLLALAYQGKTEEVARELEAYMVGKGSWDLVAHVAWFRSYYANDELIAMWIEGLKLVGFEDTPEAGRLPANR